MFSSKKKNRKIAMDKVWEFYEMVNIGFASSGQSPWIPSGENMGIFIDSLYQYLENGFTVDHTYIPEG